MDAIHSPEAYSGLFFDNPSDIFADSIFNLDTDDFEFLEFENHDMKSGSEALCSLEDADHVGLFTWTENLVLTYASTDEERSGHCGQGPGHFVSQSSGATSPQSPKNPKSKNDDTRGAPVCSGNDMSSTRKRKLDPSMTVFPVAPNEEMNVRTRAKYSPSRRRQVAQNRLLGACIQCRVRKGPVSITLLEVDLGIAFINFVPV
jgi:hypothetical protein